MDSADVFILDEILFLFFWYLGEKRIEPAVLVRRGTKIRGNLHREQGNPSDKERKEEVEGSSWLWKEMVSRGLFLKL